MAYANTNHVKTNIRTALSYGFKQITIANGYFNTVGQVFYAIPTRGMITDFPSCVLLWGETPTESPEGSGSRVDQSDTLLHKLGTLTTLWYIKEGNDAALAREQVLADVEFRIGNFPHIPTSAGARTCLHSWIDSEEPISWNYNEPLIGQKIDIKIRYRQTIADPTGLD